MTEREIEILNQCVNSLKELNQKVEFLSGILKMTDYEKMKAWLQNLINKATAYNGSNEQFFISHAANYLLESGVNVEKLKSYNLRAGDEKQVI